jgi:hypothetical protein
MLFFAIDRNSYLALYFEAKNKTDLILPKVRQGSTKKPLNGAFLGEKLI